MIFRILFVAAIFSLLAPAESFSQTLLFSGGEDIDFSCSVTQNCYTTTNGAQFRSTWARGAYAASPGTSDPPQNSFSSPAFAANATLWVHAQYCTDYIGNCNYSTSQNSEMLGVVDSVGNTAIVVRGTGTAQQLAIASRSASGTMTVLTTCSGAINNNALTQFDLFVNYGTTGEVSLYNNSVKICDYTGDVTNGDGATTLNKLVFASPLSGNGGAWSEVIVATTDTRAMARFSAATTGDGATTGFSGTNVCSAIWSNISKNDASYGYSGASNVVHECTIKNSIPPGSYAVLGLVMSARALVGATGPQHFDFVTRVGGTNYTSSDFAPTMNFTNFSNYIQAVNPQTGSSWAVSDFQASGFNVGEMTKP